MWAGEDWVLQKLLLMDVVTIPFVFELIKILDNDLVVNLDAESLLKVVNQSNSLTATYFKTHIGSLLSCIWATYDGSTIKHPMPQNCFDEWV
jgi:hypothetical protein